MMTVQSKLNIDELTRIARASNSQQLKRDVAYVRLVSFHNPRSMMCFFIPGVAFVVGQYQKKSCRVIGIGTTVENRRKGIGRKLLHLAEEAARKRGLEMIKTALTST